VVTELPALGGKATSRPNFSEDFRFRPASVSNSSSKGSRTLCAYNACNARNLEQYIRVHRLTPPFLARPLVAAAKPLDGSQGARV